MKAFQNLWETQYIVLYSCVVQKQGFDSNSAASFYFCLFLDILQFFLSRKVEKLLKKVFISQVKLKAKVRFARIACLCQIVAKPQRLMGYSKRVLLGSTLMWFVSNSFSFG